MSGPQLPQQESSSSTTTISDHRHVDLVVPNPVQSERKFELPHAKNHPNETWERVLSTDSRTNATLHSPEVENQLPNIPPHYISENFFKFFQWTRRHNIDLHLYFICNMITLLRKTYMNGGGQFLFPLDHCQIAQVLSHSCVILPPSDPIQVDNGHYMTLIKETNLEFIIIAIDNILPLLQCSQLAKQSLEDISDKWKDTRMSSGYLHVLEELDSALQEVK